LTSFTFSSHFSLDFRFIFPPQKGTRSESGLEAPEHERSEVSDEGAAKVPETMMS
jgi:hypothetical protein